MNDKGHNPGMSEKAWKEFHKKMAFLNLKYAPKAEEEPKKSEDDSKAV